MKCKHETNGAEDLGESQVAYEVMGEGFVAWLPPNCSTHHIISNQSKRQQQADDHGTDNS